MSKEFGNFVRETREKMRETRGNLFSMRSLAGRIGVEPSFLSKVERGIESPPSEEKIVSLARELEVDSDLLLAMGGKLSTDLKETICKRPQLFAQLIRELKSMPDEAVLRLVREVRDGDW